MYEKQHMQYKYTVATHKKQDIMQFYEYTGTIHKKQGVLYLFLFFIFGTP